MGGAVGALGLAGIGDVVGDGEVKDVSVDDGGAVTATGVDEVQGTAAIADSRPSERERRVADVALTRVSVAIAMRAAS